MNINVETKFDMGDKVTYREPFKREAQVEIYQIVTKTLYGMNDIVTEVYYEIDNPEYEDEDNPFLIVKEGSLCRRKVNVGDTVIFKTYTLLFDLFDEGKIFKGLTKQDAYQRIAIVSNITVTVNAIGQDGFFQIGDLYYDPICFKL